MHSFVYYFDGFNCNFVHGCRAELHIAKTEAKNARDDAEAKAKEVSLAPSHHSCLKIWCSVTVHSCESATTKTVWLCGFQAQIFEERCKELREELKESKNEIDRLNALITDMVSREELNAAKKVRSSCILLHSYQLWTTHFFVNEAGSEGLQGRSHRRSRAAAEGKRAQRGTLATGMHI
jgi:hypothetical protein